MTNMLIRIFTRQSRILLKREKLSNLASYEDDHTSWTKMISLTTDSRDIRNSKKVIVESYE